MGRFYNTAKPTFVDDVIYKAPYQLMLGALQAQDANLKEQQEKIDAFSTMGDLLDFTDKDADKRKEIIEGYRQEANDIAEKINKNPAMYQAYIGDLNRAKRNFEQDVKTGSLFEMDRAAKRRKEARAVLQARLDKGNISQDAFEAATEKLDNNYQGHGINQYEESIHVYDQIDEGAFQKGLKEVINVDTEGTTTTKPQGNGYMIKNGEVKTYLTDERLKQIIDSDPTMDKWKREQLQTLTRQFENGRFESREEMEAEYNNRVEKFKENTIEKLGFEKINSTEETSTDSAYFQRDASARGWEELNWRKKQADKEANGYEVTMEGNYEELPDSKINELYGPGETTPAVGPVLEDGTRPKIELSVEEKRRRLDIEKASLQVKLDAIGISNKDFRNKMMTYEGRIELAKQTGMSKEALARQANYDKSYSFSNVKAPLYNGEDPTENVKYTKVVTNTFNNLPQNELVTVKVVDDRTGLQTEEQITLGEAYKKGYVTGQTTATTKSDLIPVSHPELGTGYVGLDGEIVKMQDPNNPEETIAAPKEYVLSHGLGKSQKTEQVVFDPSKPILNVTPDQVSESKKVDYGNGATTAREKKVYNVHTSTVIDGELKTVIISKELKIDPIQTKK